MALKITKGSGNVFEDMGLKDSGVLQMRAELAFELFATMKKKKLTQDEVAKLFGISQSSISRMKQGDMSHYNMESILGFLTKLNKKIELKISNRTVKQRVFKLL
jgi:predicted XRE-type DNA-binding protein